MFTEYANCGKAEEEMCKAANRVCIKIHMSDGEDFECKKLSTDRIFLSFTHFTTQNLINLKLFFQFSTKKLDKFTS